MKRLLLVLFTFSLLAAACGSKDKPGKFMADLAIDEVLSAEITPSEPAAEDDVPDYVDEDPEHQARMDHPDYDEGATDDDKPSINTHVVEIGPDGEADYLDIESLMLDVMLNYERDECEELDHFEYFGIADNPNYMHERAYARGAEFVFDCDFFDWWWQFTPPEGSEAHAYELPEFTSAHLDVMIASGLPLPFDAVPVSFDKVHPGYDDAIGIDALRTGAILCDHDRDVSYSVMVIAAGWDVIDFGVADVYIGLPIVAIERLDNGEVWVLELDYEGVVQFDNGTWSPDRMTEGECPFTT